MRTAWFIKSNQMLIYRKLNQEKIGLTSRAKLFTVMPPVFLPPNKKLKKIKSGNFRQVQYILQLRALEKGISAHIVSLIINSS